jgi:hypothetical protein
VRTRLRKSGQVKASKRTTRRRKLHIPPELQAPMTSEVEEDLRNLVARYGETKVLQALGPLVNRCKWNDWQCVANAIRRIASSQAK